MKLHDLKNGPGFTLIEIAAIMVIIGLLTSMAAAKVFESDGTVKKEALAAALSNLNSRERLLWSRIKISDGSWLTDAQVFEALETDLGPGYRWISLGYWGGVLDFRGRSSTFERTPSSAMEPAFWMSK